MLGGGNFTAQNKVLPGTYINFVSTANASSNLGERGIAAIAMPLSWGVDDAIFAVTAEEFRSNCLKIFGFSYDSDDAKGLRDLFRNIKTLYAYKLMNGGAKASNSIASAKHNGVKGNQISTEILTGTSEGTFDVNVYFGNVLVWSNTVKCVAELKAEDNGYVDWNVDTIEATEREIMANGSDGEAVGVTEHSAFLDASESFTFNALGCLSSEKSIKDLYIQEVKDMRNGKGIKYQLVVFDSAADFEGVVNVKNSLDAVWWTTGIIAGCPVNKSNTNKVYDGEFAIPVPYTQTQLELAIKAGEFVFHKVGTEIRVLTDINSLVTVTAEKGEDFKNNQTIRVLDQIAMDIARIFNTKYIGQIPNDQSGRISLWNDIVNHHQQLEAIGAIENFDSSNVVVEQGNDKKSVVVSDNVTVMNSMEKLYMTVIVA